MAKLPTGRTYNEFDEKDKTAIMALSGKSANSAKDYLDKELKPFLEGRIIILIGQAGKFSGGQLNVAISTLDGTLLTLKAIGCDPKVGPKLSGKAVRVLMDMRTNTTYYDDQEF